ncbi:anti-anti-sigma factor [Streptomyces sp. TLI_235]|nr:STAS domain-containing protein [Streptomyces sp. TLI_235]PBC69637.1 anti-anti-sigma factor [Streptomyces sp. TLI_235]
MAELGRRGRGRRPVSIHLSSRGGPTGVVVQQHPARPHPGVAADPDVGTASAPLLTTWSLRGDGSARIRLAGELDLATVAGVDRAVADCLAHRPSALDIDVSALTFCDVLGVHAFLRARRATLAARAAFRLSRPRSQLMRLLTAAHATELIDATVNG